MAKQSLVSMTSNRCSYPEPLARYEDVVANPNLFMSTLEKLHAAMGTKFMIPIIGGKELDLHWLFVEVTSRGGIEKIIRERKWKEVTAIFNFPSTATNASFVLRKYYVSLLHHYEQIYFFKARSWTPTADSLQHPMTTPVAAYGARQPDAGMNGNASQRPGANAAEFPGGAFFFTMLQMFTSLISNLVGSDTMYNLIAESSNSINWIDLAVRTVSSAGLPVTGVIDGKFESGYLVTVTIGTETLKGVLYQAPHNAGQLQQQYNIFSSRNENVHPGVPRRRRRKKSEIKRRDPAHPKPNRSGYNFFFAEQHARLKPLHLGKDREISRMIGELWNNLNEPERAVYQEKALKDKERYRVEMEDYRKRLRTGEVIGNAVPLQQRYPGPSTGIVEAHKKFEGTEGGKSLETPEIESSSGEIDSEGDETAKKDMDMEVSLGMAIGSYREAMDVDLEVPAEEPQAASEQQRKAEVNHSNQREDEEAVKGKKGLSTSGEGVEEPVANEVQMQ